MRRNPHLVQNISQNNHFKISILMQTAQMVLRTFTAISVEIAETSLSFFKSFINLISWSWDPASSKYSFTHLGQLIFGSFAVDPICVDFCNQTSISSIPLLQHRLIFSVQHFEKQLKIWGQKEKNWMKNLWSRSSLWIYSKNLKNQKALLKN